MDGTLGADQWEQGGQQIIRRTVINVLGYSCTTPTQSSLQSHEACKQSSRRALPATVLHGPNGLTAVQLPSVGHYQGTTYLPR